MNFEILPVSKKESPLPVDRKESDNENESITLGKLVESLKNEMREFSNRCRDLNERFFAKKRVEESPELENEIMVVRRKYEVEKTKLELSFLERLSRKAKTAAHITGALVVLPLLAHLTQQEFPSEIKKSENKKEITWDDPTRKEIEKLSHDYVRQVQENGYEDIPDSVLEKRFMDFVGEYGPTIRIVDSDEAAGQLSADGLSQWAFEEVLDQPRSRARNHDNTLFYQTKVMEIDSVSGLDDFVAELAHTIQDDNSFARALAYAENLVRHGFKQEEMYKDILSSEYQAHSVTEKAIREYLNPAEKDLSIKFADVYNTYHEVYKKVVATCGKHDQSEVDELLYSLISERSYGFLKSHKEVIFKNLDSVHDFLAKISGPQDQKDNLFVMLVNTFPVHEQDYSKEISSGSVEGIQELNVLKQEALLDSRKIKDLADNLEAKYRSENESRFYAKYSDKIFDDSFVKYLNDKLSDGIELESCQKLYRLYLFSLSTNFVNRPDNTAEYNGTKPFTACASYKACLQYLEEHKTIPEGKEGVVHSQLVENQKNLYLTIVIDRYLQNESVDRIDQAIAEFCRQEEAPGSWQHSAMLKLKEGLIKHGKPDCTRDFVIDGKSAFAKIIE